MDCTLLFCIIFGLEIELSIIQVYNERYKNIHIRIYYKHKAVFVVSNSVSTKIT